MLVLSRKKGETIMIGHDIELVVLSTDGDTVRLGITAPKAVAIHRKEIYEQIEQSNVEASNSLKGTINFAKINHKNNTNI